MKPSNRIKTEWSGDLAYAVGLLATDGCLYNDGRHIDFTSQDTQLIKVFQNCLGIKNKIGLKIGSYSRRPCPHVQFGDVTFYRWLLTIGITPHKSKTIGEIKIPDKYFFDFLRGHFDGDGSCYSYWDKRWRSSFMFYMYFYSASKKHILWLRDKINILIKIKGHLGNDKRAGVYQLKFAKKESKVLISKIYYRKNLPCLLRKYHKIKNILKIEYKNLPNADVAELAYAHA